MAAVTYHVAVPFDRGEDGELVPDEAMELPTLEAARRRALFLARKHAGALAFSRVGDPATGEFAPGVVIVEAGEVDRSALSSS